MAKTTSPVSPVDALILAAGKAAGTMYSKTLEAAKLARAELDSSKPLAERIAAVMTAHAAAFTTAGHNVKAIFSDALTLHACAGTQVTIPGPKNSETKCSASAATTLAKNPMRAAAKQVRDAHGIGRKTTAKPTAEKPKADASAMVRETLGEVADHMGNPDFVAKLIALLDHAGYVMAPKAKIGKRAAAAPAKPVRMADLPVHRVTGAATL